MSVVTPAGLPTLVAAARFAAHHYLADASYAYTRLHCYLRGGVPVTVEVTDPGEDALHVVAQGQGAEEVLVLKRATGVLDGGGPPELVLRTSALHAIQLD